MSLLQKLFLALAQALANAMACPSGAQLKLKNEAALVCQYAKLSKLPLPQATDDQPQTLLGHVNDRHEATGWLVHWFFLLIGAAISAGASYFIGHRSLSGNTIYQRLIGAENAALLVVIALDGTFLALC